VNIAEVLQNPAIKFDLVFNSAIDAVIITDLNGSIIEANRQAVEMHGYRFREELIGKNILWLVAPFEHDLAAKNAQQCLKQGKIREVKYHLLRADGTEFLGETNTSCLKDSTGAMIGLISITRDITGHRENFEEALFSSEDNYRRIVETTEEGIWIGSTDGKTLFVNQKMADMLGYTREEMIGQRGLNFLEVGRKDRLDAHLFLREGTSIQREYKLHRKDGSIIWTHVNASPLFNRRGKYIGNLCMHTDITERKLLEEALTLARDELAAKVEDRTAELWRSNQQGMLDE